MKYEFFAFIFLFLLVSSRAIEISHHREHLYSLNKNQLYLTENINIEALGLDSVLEFTLDDMRTVLGKDAGAALNPDEIVVLHMANSAILKGEDAPEDENDYDYLKEKWEKFKRLQLTFPTHLEARQLDGVYDTYASSERAARSCSIQSILIGKPRSLRKCYNELISEYESKSAKSEAEELYKALKGLGTTIRVVWKVLKEKSYDEIKALNRQFCSLLREKGETVDSGSDSIGGDGTNTMLYKWLSGDLSGGDWEKALDMYYARNVKTDEEYYFWTKMLNDSDEEAKRMIAHGSFIEKGIGWFNQAVFAASKWTNVQVEEAQKFWMELASRQNNKVGKYAAMTMFVFATIGGSLGTKALDPTLPHDMQAEGIIDLAVTVGTLGCGLLLKGAMGTRAGIAALRALAPILQKASRVVFMIKRALRLTASETKCVSMIASLNRAKAVAEAANQSRKVRKLERAISKYETTLSHIRRGKTKIAEAEGAKDAFRALVESNSPVDDITAAGRRVEDAGTSAGREIDAARAAETEATIAARQAAGTSSALDTLLARELPSVSDDLSRSIQSARSAGRVSTPSGITFTNPVEIIELADGTKVISKSMSKLEAVSTQLARETGESLGISVPRILGYTSSADDASRGVAILGYADGSPLSYFIKGVRGPIPEGASRLKKLIDVFPDVSAGSKIPLSEFQKVEQFYASLQRLGMTQGDFHNMAANILVSYDASTNSFKFAVIDYDRVVHKAIVSLSEFENMASKDIKALERLKIALQRKKILETAS